MVQNTQQLRPFYYFDKMHHPLHDHCTVMESFNAEEASITSIRDTLHARAFSATSSVGKNSPVAAVYIDPVNKRVTPVCWDLAQVPHISTASMRMLPYGEGVDSRNYILAACVLQRKLVECTAYTVHDMHKGKRYILWTHDRLRDGEYDAFRLWMPNSIQFACPAVLVTYTPPVESALMISMDADATHAERVLFQPVAGLSLRTEMVKKIVWSKKIHNTSNRMHSTEVKSVELEDRVIMTTSETILSGKSNASVGVGVYACNRCKSTMPKMQVCGKCKSVRYCSKECQLADWNERRHRCPKHPQLRMS
jgi:hypothetical protein